MTLFHLPNGEHKQSWHFIIQKREKILLSVVELKKKLSRLPMRVHVNALMLEREQSHYDMVMNKQCNLSTPTPRYWRERRERFREKRKKQYAEKLKLCTDSNESSKCVYAYNCVCMFDSFLFQTQRSHFFAKVQFIAHHRAWIAKCSSRKSHRIHKYDPIKMHRNIDEYLIIQIHFFLFSLNFHSFIVSKRHRNRVSVETNNLHMAK